jgi:hypothetical protein
VLAALEPAHFGLVRKTSIDHLCRILQDRRNHLVIVVLEALEKVGGGSAAAPVAKLLKRSKAKDVQRAASRVLPVLEARHRDEQAPQILLRATGSPTVDEGVLLRPHEAMKDFDTGLLLRPTDDEKSNELYIEPRIRP